MSHTDRQKALGLPHACGGVSTFIVEMDSTRLSSPRMWGCFRLHEARQGITGVFPTHVGVFPHCRKDPRTAWSLPHACGGVSNPCSSLWRIKKSSPRMWGCFQAVGSDPFWDDVFPTHVGVFLPQRKGLSERPRLPHACGGVSHYCRSDDPEHPSSPRMWGCFWICTMRPGLFVVFPTHVGVFLQTDGDGLPTQSLPHACGGVSFEETNGRLTFASSPRMWGCFQWRVGLFDGENVFPTHVGVFLCFPTGSRTGSGLPHACGGVSFLEKHTKSCECVFPTHVGVFLPRRARGRSV